MSDLGVSTEETLGGLLAVQAATAGERVAVAYPDAALTFTELHVQARELARALLAHGVGSGDRIGIFMPNSLEYIQLIFAASLVGAQLVPINARFKRRELSYVVGSSEISICSRLRRSSARSTSPTSCSTRSPGCASR